MHAELLPQDKLQLVKAYKNGDAPAAATAAAAAAQENTHHVLLVDSEQAGNASDNGCCASSQSCTVAHVGEQLAYLMHWFVVAHAYWQAVLRTWCVAQHPNCLLLQYCQISDLACPDCLASAFDLLQVTVSMMHQHWLWLMLVLPWGKSTPEW